MANKRQTGRPQREDIIDLNQKKMDNEENLLTRTSELRIVLIGRVGDDKPSVMNILLRSSEEKRKPAAESAKEKYQKENITISEHELVVVDTPGLCHSEKEDEEVMKEVKSVVSKVAPGPHVFLLVLPLDRFTMELQDMVKIFKTSFGDCVIQYTMVVFPDGEQLQDETIENFIGGNEELTKFVNDDCKKRYHVVNSTDDLPQVTQLVQKIKTMVKSNKGKYYTGDEALKRKKIALSINGSALVGAGVGGAVTHFVGSTIGFTAGLALGAIVGGVAGCLGYIAVERWKKKGCVLQ